MMQFVSLLYDVVFIKSTCLHDFLQDNVRNSAVILLGIVLFTFVYKTGNLIKSLCLIIMIT